MILSIFLILSVGLIASAIMVVFQKSAMHSALFLILTFLFLGGFYLLLGAEFVAFAHVIVYAGAVMVLFLFVIMLLNLKKDPGSFVKGPTRKFIALFLGGIVILLILVMVLPEQAQVAASGSLSVPNIGNLTAAGADQSRGNTQSIGSLLYSRYLLPFEIASVLLLVAMIGAVVLAKKEL